MGWEMAIGVALRVVVGVALRVAMEVAIRVAVEVAKGVDLEVDLTDLEGWRFKFPTPIAISHPNSIKRELNKTQ